MLKKSMTEVEGYNFPEISKKDIEKQIGPILLKDRKLNADGGRIGLKGGLTPSDYLKVKDMLNHYHDYKKGGGKKLSKADFAIAFFRENNADGGRIGYKFGLGPLFNFLNKKSPAKAYTDYLKSVKDRVKAGKEAEVAGEVIPIAAGGALITNQVKKKLKAMN